MSSHSEVKFDAKFIEPFKKLKAKYESTTIEYRVEETRKYTPDWTIKRRGRIPMHIEFKGVLTRATRKKMTLVKKDHPDLDIRFVFEKARNKIYRGSKTTYGMWATKHGFPWADNVLPREWLK